MSLIIEGIDMPTKDKAPLQFTVWSDGMVYCRDVIEKIETATAIQIPKGHGRIVDADTIFQYGAWDERAVSEAPTILDAEERHEL